MGCSSSKEEDVVMRETPAASSSKCIIAISTHSPQELIPPDHDTPSANNNNPKLKVPPNNLRPKSSSALDKQAAVAVNQKGAHHLRNIFAAPLEDLGSFQAPIFSKSEEEKEFIRESLKNNFVFAGLSEREVTTIIDAFEIVQAHAHETLIHQGDVGDYFYVMRNGTVRFEVHGNVVGHASKGKSFGELALLYTSPRAASVIAEASPTTVYRVDQKTFRYIMQSQTLQTENDKKDLLQGVTFLQDLDPTDINKLVHTMTPRVFEPGEYIVQKGEDGDTFYVIQEGKVRVTSITIGSTDYEDQTLGPGDYFGERALVTKEPRSANCIGKCKGIALSIDKDTFEKVVGKLASLTVKAEDRRKLSAIRLFQMTHLSQPTLAALASQFVETTFPPKTQIITEGKSTNASLYLVRAGKVEMKSCDGEHNNIIDSGGYFGEDMLELDVGNLKKSTSYVAKYTIKTLSEIVVVAMLTIEECRKTIDTTSLGRGRQRLSALPDSNIPIASLDKHGMLGAGTFGQVWLVSYVGTDKRRRPYALKIQSKFDLVKNHQAKSVVQEKNLMQQLHNPFLINLVQTYQDTQYVYMLLGLVQGGELFSLLHQTTYDGISEKDAKFYASGVLEGLSHMHRRHIIYRDLKPENVLIDGEGYPVMVDFGFAKYVTTKTYTLCGTPLYLAPEVILNRGHDRGADHWSLACVIFEMISGHTPFYRKGMDQITLFKRICNGVYKFPPAGVMTMEVEDLLQRFFVLDPAKRLGSLARGINEIYAHTWLSDLDFSELRHRDHPAPWIPGIKDPLDKSNFENWDHLEDKTTRNDPVLSKEEQRIFQTFSETESSVNLFWPPLTQ